MDQGYSYVKMTEDMGRGMFVTQSLLKGTIVCRCEILMLTPEDTIKVNTTELQHYTFKVNDLQDCLVLGNGEIFNHSDTPNVEYNLVTIDGRLMMEFKTLRPISGVEQLFIDYAADSNVNVQSYLNSKSLVG